MYVALVAGPIQTEREIIKLLEFAKKTGRPVIVIAEEFESEALTAMVVNKLQLNLKIVAIKTPMLMSDGLLEDLQAFSGAKIVGDCVGAEFEDICKVEP